MESLKIVLVCIGAAGLYGIIHDQFTARICLEYFIVFHPPVFQTQSPTLLALGWGVVATWWVGAILGILLVIASRLGRRPKLSASDLIRPIGTLLVVMAASAVFCGSLGFLLCRQGYVFPPAWIAPRLAPSIHARFMADWWAHTASYAIAFFGGIALCIVQYRRRVASP